MKKFFVLAVCLSVAFFVAFLTSCSKSSSNPSSPSPKPTATMDVNSNDRYEPDNAPSGTTLTVGAAGQAHNLFDATQDYFHFAAVAGDTYQIIADTYDGTLRPQLDITDGSVDNYAYMNAKKSAVLTFRPAVTGEFDFYVQPDTTTNTGTATGYTIHVVKMPAIIPAAFNTAVDNTDYTFTFAGSGNWFGQGNISTYGGSSAQSPPMGIAQAASFSTTITGPHTVSFKWKVSSELCCDGVRFKVDGIEITSIQGEVEWILYSYDVTGAGSHTIEWEYYKDTSDANGYDAAWIDQITVI